jgi:hypothetical protein
MRAYSKVLEDTWFHCGKTVPTSGATDLVPYSQESAKRVRAPCYMKKGENVSVSNRHCPSNAENLPQGG